MNIYLIGYRCTGKTSVGKRLAQMLQRPFVDMDDEITKQLNMTISEIVKNKGWRFFREKEKAIIKAISRLNKRVVATGGGAVMCNQNILAMRQSGNVIWLKARPRMIHKRIIADTRSNDFRPALTDKGLLDEIIVTIEKRNKYYKEAMDFYIDTDNLGVEGVTDRIIEHLDGQK